MSATNHNLTLWNSCDKNSKSTKDADIASAKRAIAAGADVNYTHENRSCLAWAVLSDNIEMLKLLLEAGADTVVKDDAGSTVLMTAVGLKRNACIEALLAAGADKETKDDDGCTPLIRAASAGHITSIALLLQAGADIEVKTNAGLSALFLAVFKDHIDCVRALVRFGADVNVKIILQIGGVSIVDYASTRNNEALMAALRVKPDKLYRCAQCKKTTLDRKKSQKCPVCRTTSYCGRACQVAHWPIHNVVCKPRE
jgi:ankyrin repeat protein